MNILLIILSIGALFPYAMGLLMIFHIFIRKKNSPVDESNRINHFRLVWFAMTREDKFVTLFPWLKKDEWDNVEGDN